MCDESGTITEADYGYVNSLPSSSGKFVSHLFYPTSSMRTKGHDKQAIYDVHTNEKQ